MNSLLRRWNIEKHKVLIIVVMYSSFMFPKIFFFRMKKSVYKHK